jgi:ribosomal protein L11 methyltransferase
MPKYISIVIEGTREDLETAIAFIFEAGCTGTEETTDSLFKAYFPAHTDIDRLSSELARQFPRTRFGAVAQVEERDWSSAWKKDLRGFSLGEKFFVLPSWKSPPRTNRTILRIDPERAFGTGAHDTTRLCLELIECHAGPGTSVIDAGTGTGILAMAAAALGCKPVVAIESDSEAASCARNNIRRNHLESVIQIHEASLSESMPPPADLIVANLNEAVIEKELARLTSWVLPGGTLILSGLLVEQAGNIASKLPSEFRFAQHRTAGEWSALLCRRISHA